MCARRSRCTTPDHLLLLGMHEISERLVAVPCRLLHFVYSLDSHLRPIRLALESVQGTILEVDGKVLEGGTDSFTPRFIDSKEFSLDVVIPYFSCSVLFLASLILSYMYSSTT